MYSLSPDGLAGVGPGSLVKPWIAEAVAVNGAGGPVAGVQPGQIAGGRVDFNRPRARVLAAGVGLPYLIMQLCLLAGGRPVCPLCGLPMEAEGHACVRSNGHSKQPIPEEEQDEDSET